MENKILLLYHNNDKIYEKYLNNNFQNCNKKYISEKINPFEIENLAKEINSTYSKVVFLDYSNQFYQLLPLIKKKTKKFYIITSGISSFAFPYIFNNFSSIIEYYNRGLIDKIYSTNYETANTFDNINYLCLNYTSNEISPKKDYVVGIIDKDYDETVNFYNQISAVCLTRINTIYTTSINSVTKDFCKRFNIIAEKKCHDEIMNKPCVNIYVKFTNINSLYFINSMNNGIPCILGNTSLLDNNKFLKNTLVLKSDDDVNEIAEKIEYCINNKNKILNEYKNWYEEYTKKSMKCINEIIRST